jgi:plastocyanin
VRLVPEQDEEDGTPTLCDPKPAPQVTESWTLQGTAVQDWENDAGFVEFCRLNSGLTVAFEWVPNTTHAVTFSGSCQVRAVEIGGDVGVQNTTDFEFPVVGELLRSDI